MIIIMSFDIVDFLVENAVKRRLSDQGAYLFHQDDVVESVYVIEGGSAELVRYQKDGAQIVLQRAADRSILAEASIYSETYHCDGIVTSSAMVFSLPKSTFLKLIDENNTISNLWARHLAVEVQSARFRSEILGRKTVSDRLDGWLAWRNNNLPLKGQWKSIAEQIGVSPEALYRELAKRRNG